MPEGRCKLPLLGDPPNKTGGKSINKLVIFSGSKRGDLKNKAMKQSSGVKSAGAKEKEKRIPR